MIFHDSEVEGLDLTSPSGIQQLVEVHLCGHTVTSELSNTDQQLLEEFVKAAAPAGMTFGQLNELLLVLNQDIVSRAFFDFFFSKRSGNKPITGVMLRDGVIRFKGFAMTCFGNFRFAFSRLSRITGDDKLQQELGDCCRQSRDIECKYDNRPPKVLDVSLIERDHTWFVGEITGRLVADELKKFEEYRKANPNIAEKEDSIAFAKHLVEMDRQFTKVQEVALRNTNVYLTWDFLDIYVATSMRNKWEYEEIFDFTQELFSRPELTTLNLRYFDPTQSKCATSRDKGLLEGLMLKRAACTIYMAQEADTLGKDSELATTLAQGKPVIAYVPKIDPNDFAKTIDKRPLKYTKLRLLGAQASGIQSEIDGLSELARTFLDELAQHSKQQPFELWTTRDTEEFKNTKNYWNKLCEALAKAESTAFDKRAEVLKKYHPLGMQMDLKTGVANGVLVVRSIEKCGKLLRAILTNTAEFDIRKEEGCRTLMERHSESVYRVVTDNEKLTNSFWNLYEPRE